MKLLALPLLLLPALAAADNCKHEERRTLAPSLEGVATVRFEVNSHDLELVGGTQGSPASLSVRACASDAEMLPQLVVSTRREGDTLVVRLEREGPGYTISFRPSYARLEVQARMPAGLVYDLDVGSGDAAVRGVRRLTARVGSGDLEAEGISDQAEVSVGSGDVRLVGVGRLQAHSIGSGDLEAQRIRRDARIGSLGSGDVVLDRVGGDVIVDRVGSGDLDIRQVDGDLVVHSVGSGDVNHRAVGGEVSLPRGH